MSAAEHEILNQVQDDAKKSLVQNSRVGILIIPCHAEFISASPHNPENSTAEHEILNQVQDDGSQGDGVFKIFWQSASNP